MCYNYVMMYVLQVVFRSASAHVFLFIQISSEMWDFDPSGEAWEWGYGEWGYGVWEWGYGSMYVHVRASVQATDICCSHSMNHISLRVKNKHCGTCMYVVYYVHKLYIVHCGFCWLYRRVLLR